MSWSNSGVGPEHVFEGRPFHIRLRDGRRIDWREYGREDGFPIFYFHGTPGSALEGGVFEDAALEHGARIIALDRPGMGKSDFLPGRRIVDWPADVSEVARHLGIKTYSIVGWSGGGPHALVCALPLASQLRALGMVAPQTEHAIFNNDVERWAGRLWMPALKLLTKIPQLGEDILEMGFRLSDRRRAARSDKGIYRRIFARSNAHAQQASSRGVIHENDALLSDWGITISQIAAQLHEVRPPLPITVWQGGKDTSVDISGSRHLAAVLPDCNLKFDPKASHLDILLDQAEDIVLSMMHPELD
ncbi:alpha/beta fold hydrolase [Actinomyces minihominis]|uniref:alpha/beta fold hydrolase n=1 Tax=Actinomyces minihominis TaxID=2002838 RepID=UPI000C06D89F|nr:alpha/beta hydrolase [Actinomyces minihominis]